MANEKKKNYKDTLNLPSTSFDMRAGLLQKEPKMLERWNSDDIYSIIREKRQGCPRFILHDGPPYANGNIHIGHTLNKVLKDMTIRVKNMTGFDAPYIPGWDCHGLPIEAKVMENLGERAKELDSVQIRFRCQKYADKFVKLQAGQFRRLGCVGDWDNPYITMDPNYEAEILGVFAKLIEKGLVFRQLKPVHWSIANQTALADAELEYQDRDDLSIYVAFEVAAGGENIPTKPGDKLCLAIWTTTPWTLPANRGVAVHPLHEYKSVHVDTEAGGVTLVLAGERLEALKAISPEWFESAQVLGTITGQELIEAGMTYEHPITPDMTCPVVGAEYVTFEDGTGLVHTAPGHGTDDYFTGLKNNLEVYCPVLADGTFDETAPDYIQGKSVWDANEIIVSRLKDQNMLIAAKVINHSYPHDWRSKTPVIFRATKQWFIGVDRHVGQTGETLRNLAKDYCSKTYDEGGVDFVPNWGRNRINGMLENRPDWCVSRQRSWGLPIPAFYNEQGEPLCTTASVYAVSQVVREQGSDAWFKLTPAELLANYNLHEDPEVGDVEAFAFDKLTKGADIFDVWFESGGSWAAVALQRGLVDEIPVDLYLEGSDQHRGWFQLSLLPAIGAEGCPPFKTVLTHGFINDEEGKKMSKSVGNTVDVQQQLEKRGADILRLWVASQDYRDDDRCSDKIIAQCEDTYRKIRNTLRFCLGSIGDYNPATDYAAPAEHSIDLWMRMELHQLVRDVRDAFDKYEFHRACRMLYEFCTIQTSSVYMSAVKDRLYCDAKDSPRRRATQAVLREVFITLVKFFAPILPFTTEEAWAHMPFKPEDSEQSIHLEMLPEVDRHAVELAETLAPTSSDFMNQPDSALAAGPAWIWNWLMDLRGQGLVKLEQLRQEGVKKSLDAEAIFVVPQNRAGMKRILEEYLSELEDLLGVGFARIEDGPASEETIAAVSVRVEDAREKYSACERSWKRRPDVGADAEFPGLSARDAAAVKAIRG